MAYVPFLTQGYSDIKFSSKQRGSNTGPKDFKVQASIDNVVWEDVPNTVITVANDNYVSGVLDNVSLPSKYDDKVTAYLRWIVTSETAINGTPIGGSGVNRLAETTITGVHESETNKEIYSSVDSGSSVSKKFYSHIDNTKRRYKIRIKWR